MEKTALARAVSLLGSQAAVAAACGKKQQNVWWWLNRSHRVPAEAVLPIEMATGGRVTRNELRPDLYPLPDSSEGRAA